MNKTTPPTAATAAHDLFVERWDRRDALAAAAMLLGAILFTASLWLDPWFRSHEVNHQLTRLAEMSDALRGGQFPVRWADNLMAGHGFPFFNFYAPLSFLLASMFHFVGFSLTTAWKLEFLLVCAAGALGMYGLLRPYAARGGALAGAMLFQFAPYHALTLFVRGNAAEFTALCLWPLAFWALDAAARRNAIARNAAIALAGAAIAAVAVSHTLTGYMAAYSLAAWAVFRIWLAGRREQTRRRLPRLAAILALCALFSAALSAFYVVPAFTELRHVSTHVLHERTQFTEHFLFPHQLFVPNWQYGLSVPGPDDGMDFQLGIALWVGLLGAGVVGLKKRDGVTAPLAVLAGVLALLHLFGTLGASAILWPLFPRSEYLQFPWRLLIPGAFWASVAGGVAAGALLGALRGRRHTSAFAAIIIIPAALVLTNLRPGGYYEEAPIIPREFLREIMMDTAEMEYLPRWVETLPQQPSRLRLLWVDGSGVARLVEQRSGSHLFDVEAHESGTVAFEQFHYPGWTVIVDGEAIASTPLEQFGLVSFELPAGGHVVEVVLRETPLRRAANGVTLGALASAIVWIGALAIARVRSSRKSAAS